MRTAPVILLVAAVLLPACSKDNLLNERNPFYRQGRQLAEKKLYDKAVRAFERCLLVSPRSSRAHLELGMIYEDHYTRPLTALHHYAAYLEKTPDGEDAEQVTRWVTRLERACLQDLLSRHSDQGGQAMPRPTPVEEPSAKEKKLQDQVKLLHEDKTALQRRIDALEQRVEQERRRADTETQRAADAEQRYRDAIAAEPTPEPAPQPEPAPTPAAAPTAAPTKRTHVVTRGDTLSAIARRYYGTDRHWRHILDHNAGALRGSDRITPGMLLEIPPLQPQPAANAE